MATGITNVTGLLYEQIVRQLVLPLQSKSKFLSAGPQIFDTHVPIKIPKLGGAVSSVGLTAENAFIPTRDVTVGSVSLLPSSMDSVKVWSSFSNESVRQSALPLDNVVQRRLVTDVANEVDSVFFSAGGDGVDTPYGLFSTYGGAGMQTHAVPSGTITFDVLLDAEEKAATANVDVESLKWVFDLTTYYRLRKIKTATTGSNEYLMQPSVTKPGTYTIFGHEVVISDKIPQLAGSPNTRRGALVDFSQIAVARDLAPSVTVHPDTEAQYDRTAIRIVARYDAKPLNAAAIVQLTGITL